MRCDDLLCAGGLCGRGCVAWCLQSEDTPLLVACSTGQLAVVQWLIDEKGVDCRTEMNEVSGKLLGEERQCWRLCCAL